MQVSPLLFLYFLATMMVLFSGFVLFAAGFRRRHPTRALIRQQPLALVAMGGGLLQILALPWILPVHDMRQVVPAVVLGGAGVGLLVYAAKFSQNRESVPAALLGLIVAVMLPWQLHTALLAHRANVARQAAASQKYPRLVAQADFDIYAPLAQPERIADAGFEAASDGRSQYRLAALLPSSEVSAVLREFNVLHTPYPSGNCGLWAAYERGDCRLWATTPAGTPVYGEFYTLDKPVYVFVTYGVTRVVVENWRWIDQSGLLKVIDSLQAVSAAQAPHKEF